MAETEDIQAATRKHCGDKLQEILQYMLQAYSVAHFWTVASESVIDQHHHIELYEIMPTYLDWICNVHTVSLVTLRDLVKTDICNLNIEVGLLDHLYDKASMSINKWKKAIHIKNFQLKGACNPSKIRPLDFNFPVYF